MKTASLQLKASFVTELVLKAVPLEPGVPAPTTPVTMSLSTKVHHAQSNSNPRDWRVGLRVSCQPGGNGHCPYLVDLELIGFFEVGPGVKDDDIKPLVMANAPALLYGSARELVQLITGRGPNGSLTLPAATFVDEAGENRKAAGAMEGTAS